MSQVPEKGWEIGGLG